MPPPSRTEAIKARYASLPTLRLAILCLAPTWRNIPPPSVTIDIAPSPAISTLVELSGPDLTPADRRFYATSVPTPTPQPDGRADHAFQATHPAMGTEFTLELYAPTQARADELFTAAFDEIDRLEALLSNYQPSSELSRLSRDASRAPTTTDPETFQFLTRSQFWSRESHGAFDITVGPLLRAWGFFQHGGAIPSAATLQAARAHTGFQHLHLSPATRTVSADTPRDLDPGSIGKGFAVDHVVALLRAQGVTRALLSAGNSTLYGLGTPPGQPGWPVHIPDPLHPPHTTLTYLRDTSLSTGACTEKYFIRNGHRYCHIFNPLTGRPVEGTLQTTVLDRSATDSDALSTVLFVLPPARSRALLQHHPEVHALVYRLPATCLALNWSAPACAADAAPNKEPSHP